MADEEDLSDLLRGMLRRCLLATSTYRVQSRAVVSDLAILQDLCIDVHAITPGQDPKLAAIVEALEAIVEQAGADAISDEDARQKRKVIVFSFFADTVGYLRRELRKP